MGESSEAAYDDVRDLVISALAKMVRNEYDGLDDDANVADIVDRWWAQSTPAMTDSERAAVRRGGAGEGSVQGRPLARTSPGRLFLVRPGGRGNRAAGGAAQ